MEAQIHTLREELIQVNTQRKQQLVELSLLREEEKQKTLRDHEAAMNKLKVESEKMILDLQKSNATEMEMALEKVSTETGPDFPISRKMTVKLPPSLSCCGQGE